MTPFVALTLAIGLAFDDEFVGRTLDAIDRGLRQKGSAN